MSNEISAQDLCTNAPRQELPGLAGWVLRDSVKVCTKYREPVHMESQQGGG